LSSGGSEQFVQRSASFPSGVGVRISVGELLQDLVEVGLALGEEDNFCLVAERGNIRRYRLIPPEVARIVGRSAGML